MKSPGFAVGLFALLLACGWPGTASAQNYCAQASQNHRQLSSVIERCMGEVNNQLAQMQRLAPQGIMVPPPQCQANMPQWIAQLRYIEAQIGHCQGDPRSLCEQQGYPPGCESYRPRY